MWILVVDERRLSVHWEGNSEVLEVAVRYSLPLFLKAVVQNLKRTTTPEISVRIYASR